MRFHKSWLSDKALSPMSEVRCIHRSFSSRDSNWACLPYWKRLYFASYVISCKFCLNCSCWKNYWLSRNRPFGWCKWCVLMCVLLVCLLSTDREHYVYDMDDDDVQKDDGRSARTQQSDESYVRQQLDSIYQQMACIVIHLVIHY